MVKNPFTQERLTPNQLSTLFPSTFYQSDEALALHLKESCLVEKWTWDGDDAIGETAFWLKVLSTPQSPYLKKQKRLFKLAIYEKCKNLSLNVAVAKSATKLPADGGEEIIVQFEDNKMETSEDLPEVVIVPDPSLSQKDGNSGASAPPQVVAKSVKKLKVGGGAEVIIQYGGRKLETSEDLPEVVIVPDPSADQKDANSSASAPPQGEPPAVCGEDGTNPGFGINSYKCKLCEFSTHTRELLNIHQKSLHADDRPYSCTHCDYTSRYPWNIKTHIENVHLKVKKFKCDKCDFAAPQACLLRKHNLVHNEKMIKCDYCDYMARFKDVLRRHVNMKHTKDFSHKCPYCPFGRDAKNEVEDHINAVHMKKVVYQCPDCSFQTFRKYSLRTHQKEHDKKQLLRCTVCEFKSMYPFVLARHMKTEHPDSKFPEELSSMQKKEVKFFCTICNMNFANRRNMRKHNERKHQSPPTETTETSTNQNESGEKKSPETPAVTQEVIVVTIDNL